VIKGNKVSSLSNHRNLYNLEIICNKMSKQIISVSDITAYLYCPRKLWLAKVKGIREPQTREMILGRIKHKALELFNLLEQDFIIFISSAFAEKDILEKYKYLMRQAAIKAYEINADIAERFNINLTTFLAEFLPNTEQEIKIRISPLLESMKLYKGREIWEHLSPKYKAEFSLISENLGIKGRIDRVSFGKEILPFEIKTRSKQNIYDSDKIQLAAYALLLEDKFKKNIEKGIIELGNKQQEILLDSNLKSQVIELAEKVRNIQGEFPSSFSKCQSCGIKEECAK